MTNPVLTDKHLKFLRGLAHDRKVIVQTGSGGLSDAVIAEIDVALTAHELVKTRILAEDRDERDAMIATLCDSLGAILVQRIGHVATLFRRNPKNPKIELPKKLGKKATARKAAEKKSR